MHTAEVIELPGMIDMHMHGRLMPSDEYKEGCESATRAAAAGGFTDVFDMPNNRAPMRINTLDNLVKKIVVAQTPKYASQQRRPDFVGSYVDIGMIYSHRPEDDNLGSFERAVKLTHAIKFYMEPTNENDTLYDAREFKPGVQHWRDLTNTQPIIAHAEDETIQDVVNIFGHPDFPLHIAHVSTRYQLEQIRRSRRMRGNNITCEITPHHRYLTDDLVAQLGSFACMKPPLGTAEDREYLHAHISEIDVFATDHAPHLNAENQEANEKNPSHDPNGINIYGVPGLEVQLGLLLHDVMRGELSIKELIDKTYTRPARIMNFTPHPGNKIAVSLETYQIGDYPTFSKASYKHFENHVATGRVVRTDIHGETIYKDGEFVKPYGTGDVLRPAA